MAAYAGMTRRGIEAQRNRGLPPHFSGVEQSDSMLEFLWSNFSAAAGDQPSFECWRKWAPPHPHPHSHPQPKPRAKILRYPAANDTHSASQEDYYLHEVMLAGWGMPIGELFDLEKLGEHCKRTGRYSFFVASEPVNVSGLLVDSRGILLMSSRCRAVWRVRRIYSRSSEDCCEARPFNPKSYSLAVPNA